MLASSVGKGASVTEWITLDMPVDVDASLVLQSKETGWTGGPKQREEQQTKQDQILDEERRYKEFVYSTGALAADGIKTGIKWGVAESTQSLLSNANNTAWAFFGPVLGAGSVAVFLGLTIGVHAVFTSARPLFNRGFNPLNPMGLLQLIGNIGNPTPTNTGNRFGPYEIATPFLIDNSPPGAWDFTLIDPDTRSQYVPVPSPCDGVVSESGWISGYGNSVAVDCTDQTTWFMAHNDSLSVGVGQAVREGDELSIQGSTGNSTGPHVHLEITLPNGSKTDRAATRPLVDNYFEQLKTPPQTILASFDNHTIAATPQIQAFLDTIAWAEGADYNTLVGGGTFHDFSKHPDRYHAPSNSDAAGKYQFLNPTWKQYANKLGLPDFSPASQDRAAIAILEENGVPTLLAAGRVDEAFCAVGSVWASLPCNNHGQPQKTARELRQKYGDKMGVPPQVSPRTQDLLNRGKLRI